MEISKILSPETVEVLVTMAFSFVLFRLLPVLIERIEYRPKAKKEDLDQKN